MHVPSPAATQLLEIAYLPRRTAMTTMHVPLILAISTLETASTMQLLATMVTDVLLTDVILFSDASMTRRTAMIKTHVPLILATQPLDVSTHQKMLMIKTFVPEIGVMLRLEKLNTKVSFVMTRTHVPLNLATLSLDASTDQLTCKEETMKILTNASSSDVLKLKDSSVTTLTVMTTTHVPMIAAMQPLENAVMFQEAVMTKTHALMTAVMQLKDA